MDVCNAENGSILLKNRDLALNYTNILSMQLLYIYYRTRIFTEIFVALRKLLLKQL